MLELNSSERKMSMKKIVMILIVMLFFVGGNDLVRAEEYFESQMIEKDKKNMDTIEDAEFFLFEYLKTKGNELKADSQEFFNYVMQQVMEDEDQDLINNENYNSIYVYMSEYFDNASEYGIINETLSGFSMNQKYLLKINDILRSNELENQQDLKLEQGQWKKPKVGKWGNLKLSKAKSYAKKHYKTRNNKYKNFSSTGGNCTNFVSQILVAAGGIETFPKDWKSKKEITNTSSYWYAKKDGNKHKISSSFIRVEDMYKYWMMVGRTFNKKDWKKSISYASSGDIIQYKNKANKWYHAGFIYRKDKNNLYVSMNNNDYLERPLSESMKSSEAIRIIKTYME